MWDRAVKELGATETTVFTYGEDIYVPSGQQPTADLLAHEGVHMQQQAGDPAAWWERYFGDPHFRQQQELEAYRAQYAFFCSLTKDRGEQFRFRHSISSALAGPLYGRVMPYADAFHAIAR